MKVSLSHMSAQIDRMVGRGARGDASTHHSVTPSRAGGDVVRLSEASHQAAEYADSVRQQGSNLSNIEYKVAELDIDGYSGVVPAGDVLVTSYGQEIGVTSNLPDAATIELGGTHHSAADVELEQGGDSTQQSHAVAEDAIEVEVTPTSEKAKAEASNPPVHQSGKESSSSPQSVNRYTTNSTPTPRLTVVA